MRHNYSPIRMTKIKKSDYIPRAGKVKEEQYLSYTIGGNLKYASPLEILAVA